MASATHLIDLSAAAAVAAMRHGEIKAEDYAHALLQRARSLEVLNAFRVLDDQKVLEAARDRDRARVQGKPCGALHGLPIPIKDSINTSSLPTSNGTRALRDFVPKHDAPILKPLWAQGALLMGKTNLHELSRGWTSNNGAFGPVRNPHNVDHIPGGSSGGSAAAVAARIAPLAIAEDTLGSIRVPASLCGIAGLRPTFGRYPSEGIMSLTLDKLDQAGPLARSVADLALFDSVVTADARPLQTRELREVRIGVSREYFLSGLDPEVERIVAAAIETIRAAGATIVAAEAPALVAEALPIATTIIAYENRISIASYLQEQQAGLTFPQLLAQVSANIQRHYSTTPPERDVYEAALRKRAALREAMRDYFGANSLDALAFPPTLAPAPPLGDNFEFEIRGNPVPILQVMGRNTALGSVASLASLILPAGLTTSGLPVGLELAAPSGHDRALLALGLAIESLSI